eukprot:COSAG05_NODE_6173_length_1008_cov_1.303630_1_plen_173_part_10
MSKATSSWDGSRPGISAHRSKVPARKRQRLTEGGEDDASLGPLLDVTREDWDRMTHNEASSHTRAEDREDMQTMTGVESLGASTRGQFSFDPEGRLQRDGIMNCDFCNSSDPGDWQEQQVFNAGQGYHFEYADDIGEYVRTRPAMLSRPEGGGPRDYTDISGRTVYTGGRRG